MPLSNFYQIQVDCCYSHNKSSLLKVNDWNYVFLLDFIMTLLTFVELISCYVKYYLNRMHHLIRKPSICFVILIQNYFLLLLFMMMGLGAKSLIFDLLCPMGLRKIFCPIKIYFQRMVLVVVPRIKHSKEMAFELGTLNMKR